MNAPHPSEVCCTGMYEKKYTFVATSPQFPTTLTQIWQTTTHCSTAVQYIVC